MQWLLRLRWLVTRARATMTPKGTKPLRWLSPFIPLFLLAIDIAVFPVLIETSDPDKDVTGISLISAPYPMQYLGNFMAHRIYVSLDDIDDSYYPQFITQGAPDKRRSLPMPWTGLGHPNAALALSMHRNKDAWESLELDRIEGKLDSPASADDRDGIINLVNDTPQSKNVFWYDFKTVSSASPATSSLPLDHLVVMRFESSDKSEYSAGIREMLETAARKHLSTLVLPCLASPSLNRNDYLPACDRTYEALFQALEPGRPAAIVLSLEKNLGTEAIPLCIRSIKENWSNGLKRDDKSPGPLPTLYRSNARLLLLFLPVCLMVSSFRVQLTLKNYMIACIAFFGVGYEAQEKLAPLLNELAESVPEWIFKCLILAILSGGFVFFAGLDIEGFLGNRNDKPPKKHD